MAEPAPHESSCALAGVRVLVTRPRHQSDALVALIEARGGQAIRFPVIDILPAADAGAARAAMQALDEYSLVIFTSSNAVEHGLALLDAIPDGAHAARVAAVGATSAAQLEKAGFGPVLHPRDGASSEALLALEALSAESIAGRRVLVVRGEGGRELLGRTLAERGAEVGYAEVYRRVRPRRDTTRIAEQGRAGAIDVIVATSVEGLDNLFALLGETQSDWLQRAGYVVLSERIAARARTMGIRASPVVAARADVEGIVDALIRWRSTDARYGS